MGWQRRKRRDKACLVSTATTTQIAIRIENHRTTTVPKPGQKFIIIHYGFVQIGGHQALQQAGIGIWVAIPFSRIYHPRCGRISKDQKLYCKQSPGIGRKTNFIHKS